MGNIEKNISSSNFTKFTKKSLVVHFVKPALNMRREREKEKEEKKREKEKRKDGAHFTVNVNIIATIKMRNYFCYPLKMVIFPILR